MGKFLVTLFLGWAGVHKFMEKKNKMGFVYLLTLGLFGIGWLIDIVIAATKINSQKPKQIVINNNTLRIDVVGEHYRKNDIASVLSGNRLYGIPDTEFLQKIEEQKNIYRFKYREAEAQLIPEPTNQHDGNAIKVLVDNIHVGYIPSERCLEVKNKLKQIKSVNAHIHGGDYKYHSNNEVFKTEADFSIELYITL